MSINMLTLSYLASASVLPYRVVAFASELTVAPATGSTRPFVGTTGKLGASSGDMLDVVRAGIGEVRLGGVVAAGDPLTADASARAVKAVAGDQFFGFADEPGSAETIISYLAAFGGLGGGVTPPPPTPTVTLSADLSQPEGNSGATLYTYTVTRSATVGAVSVPWTFAAGGTNAADFIGGVLPVGGTVALANGVASGTFVISVAGDTTVEGNETFGVSITAPAGYALGAKSSATGAIVNDDAAGGGVAPGFTLSAPLTIAMVGSSSETSRGPGSGSVNTDGAKGIGYLDLGLKYLEGAGFSINLEGQAGAQETGAIGTLAAFNTRIHDYTNMSVSSVSSFGGAPITSTGGSESLYPYDVRIPSDGATIIACATAANQQMFYSFDGGVTETLYTFADTGLKKLALTAPLASTRTIRLRFPAANSNAVRLSVLLPTNSTINAIRQVNAAARGTSIGVDLTSGNPYSSLTVLASLAPDLMQIVRGGNQDDGFAGAAGLAYEQDNITLARAVLAAGGWPYWVAKAYFNADYYAIVSRLCERFEVPTAYGCAGQYDNVIPQATAQTGVSSGGNAVDGVPHYNAAWHSAQGNALGADLNSRVLPAVLSRKAAGFTRSVYDLSINAATATEGTGGTPQVRTWTVTRSNKVSGAESITFTPTPGTSVTTADFSAMTVNGTSQAVSFAGIVLNFAAGETTKTVAFTINPDSDVEAATETLTGVLSAPSAGGWIGFNNVVLTINDDDTGTTPPPATPYNETYTDVNGAKLSAGTGPHTSDSGHTYVQGGSSDYGRILDNRRYFPNSSYTMSSYLLTADKVRFYDTIYVVSNGAGNGDYVLMGNSMLDCIQAGYQLSQFRWAIFNRVGGTQEANPVGSWSPGANLAVGGSYPYFMERTLVAGIYYASLWVDMGDGNGYVQRIPPTAVAAAGGGTRIGFAHSGNITTTSGHRGDNSYITYPAP